jgi:hypothetical protein
MVVVVVVIVIWVVVVCRRGMTRAENLSESVRTVTFAVGLRGYQPAIPAIKYGR